MEGTDDRLKPTPVSRSEEKTNDRIFFVIADGGITGSAKKMPSSRLVAAKQTHKS